MKILVAYRTRYGCTRRYAGLLAEKLPGEVTLTDLRRQGRLSPASFDLVLLGGPIYAGALPSSLTRFCERNRAGLLRVPVGLFICCLYEGEKARAQLDSAFPQWLSLHAFGRWALGGEIRPGNLGLFDRLLVRAMGRSLGDISRFRPEGLSPIIRAAAERQPPA